MPRRTYVRIINGVPTFPLNRPVQEGDTVTVAGIPGQGSVVQDMNGNLVGRVTSLPAPRRSETVNEPAYRTMSIGSFENLRIGTASAPITGDSRVIGYVPITPTPAMVPVRFPNMPNGLTEQGIVNPGIEEDFVLMHSGIEEGASALDQLLEDDDDPISEG